MKYKKSAKRVMVFGCFDMIHKGHIHFLKQAKNKGNYLIVVLGRDKTVEFVKGEKPFFTELKRKKQLEAIPLVDKVVLGRVIDKYDVIEKHKPHIICLGYDQKAFTDSLKNELAKRKISARVLRLKPYKPAVFKSSKIKKRLKLAVN